LLVVTSDLAVPTWLVVVTLGAVLALAVAAFRLSRSVRQARRHTEALLEAAAQDAEDREDDDGAASSSTT